MVCSCFKVGNGSKNRKASGLLDHRDRNYPAKIERKNQGVEFGP
jgi:hypothetical protein